MGQREFGLRYPALSDRASVVSTFFFFFFHVLAAVHANLVWLVTTLEKQTERGDARQRGTTSKGRRSRAGLNRTIRHFLSPSRKPSTEGTLNVPNDNSNNSNNAVDEAEANLRRIQMPRGGGPQKRLERHNAPGAKEEPVEAVSTAAPAGPARRTKRAAAVAAAAAITGEVTGRGGAGAGAGGSGGGGGAGAGGAGGATRPPAVVPAKGPLAAGGAAGVTGAGGAGAGSVEEDGDAVSTSLESDEGGGGGSSSDGESEGEGLELVFPFLGVCALSVCVPSRDRQQ